jgi:hypothetical protein
MQVEKNERQMAQQHLVAAMLAGQSWQEIARAKALPLRNTSNDSGKPTTPAIQNLLSVRSTAGNSVNCCEPWRI